MKGVFVVLVGFVVFVATQYVANDPCITTSDPGGIITLSSIDFTSICWRIAAVPPPGQVFSTVTLTFETFMLQPTMYLMVYQGAFPGTHAELGAYTGNLSSPTGPPTTLVISGGRAYMALQGSGTRQFRVRYDTSLTTMTSEAYDVFWALILVFLFPLLCGTVTSLPFFSSADPQKRSRCTLILFISGTLLGILLFVLFLGKAIQL